MDKTLLQAARDALANVKDFLGGVTCDNGVKSDDGQLEGEYHAGLVVDMITATLTRLDAEIAKVAEPVDEERELDLCPHCGGVAIVDDHRDIFHVRCTVCDAGVLGDRANEEDMDNDDQFFDRLKKTAIDKWNRRQPVVLDLSRVSRFPHQDGAMFDDNDLLAAIRAQLLGIEVRT